MVYDIRNQTPIGLKGDYHPFARNHFHRIHSRDSINIQKSMQKQSILFVYVNYSSFVKADFEILSSFANVTKYQFKPGKGIFKTGIELLKEFVYLIFNISKFDSVFIWFGDYHSLLPVLFAKIFRKKSFIVIGGYDVSTLSEYGYGSFSHPIRSFFTRNTFKFVNICFPVAEALRQKTPFHQSQSEC